MEQRFDLTTVTGDAYKAVSALEATARRAVDDDRLYLILKLRASFLNGCAYCVDMHGTHLAEGGDDWRRIIAVGTWHESPFFTPAERAALALTDEVTRMAEHGVTDETWAEAVEHHGKEGAANLVVAIATINVWNRLAVTAHAPTPPLAADAPAA